MCLFSHGRLCCNFYRDQPISGRLYGAVGHTANTHTRRAHGIGPENGCRGRDLWGQLGERRRRGWRDNHRIKKRRTGQSFLRRTKRRIYQISQDTQYSTPIYTRITLLPARIRERSISPPPPSFFPSQFSDPSSPFRSFQSINVALFSPDNERVKEFRHKGKSERTGRRGIPPGIRTSSPGGYSCNSQNWFSP